MENKVIKVYLAGKIKSNGWRQQLIDIRDNFSGEEKYKIRKGITVRYDNHIIITGPFFLSCDHSCYHGENSHGVGLNKYYPDGERYDCYGLRDQFTEDEVKDICLRQIKKSDVIFAYINDDTCYGTLYELGYAKSLGKKIIILFESGKLMKDMWFIYQKADIVELVDKSERDYSIKRYFDELINKI